MNNKFDEQNDTVKFQFDSRLIFRNSYLKKSEPAHQPVMYENKTNIYFDPVQNRAGSFLLICSEKCYPRGMAT